MSEGSAKGCETLSAVPHPVNAAGRIGQGGEARVELGQFGGAVGYTFHSVSSGDRAAARSADAVHADGNVQGSGLCDGRCKGMLAS